MGQMFGHEDDVNLPEFLPRPIEDYLKLYDLWTIWRAVGAKPTEFLAALRIPKHILDRFFELDYRLRLMDRQYAKIKEKSRGSQVTAK